jgi:hypothetical protein
MVEQVVIQQQDSGSNPTPSLQFSRCTAKEVKQFVCDNHYSKNLFGANDFCFKAEKDSKLVGACVFGFLAGNPKSMCVVTGHDDPKKYRELRRLVLLDEIGKNSESRFIGWCLRWLRKNTDLIAIISFADTGKAHVGYVYQASNFFYCGLTKDVHNRFLINGHVTHTRSTLKLYHTRKWEKIHALFPDAVLIKGTPKHKYIYVLDPKNKALLKLSTLPYPK